MDFFETCKVVLRRWYVVVPLLVLACVGAYVAYSAAGTHYTAKGSLVLLAPAARPGTLGADGKPVTGCDQNPWCSGSNVSSLGNVTARSMADEQVATRIARAHPGATYLVELDADSRSPILDMTVTGPGDADTLATLRDVRGEVEQELARRQTSTGAPSDALITSANVTTPIAATVQAGGKTRAGFVALGLGLAVALGGAFLAESIAKSRRREPLLDRISLSDRSTAVAPKSEPDAASAVRATDAGERDAAAPRRPSVPVSQRRSGRVGS